MKENQRLTGPSIDRERGHKPKNASSFQSAEKGGALGFGFFVFVFSSW